jgi:hypothetical protein
MDDPISEWGVTSYRSLHIVTDEGKLYRACFMAIHGLDYTTAYVNFYAHHPVIKIREACSQPRTYRGLVEFLTA